ncbi:MAG TPA: hypothetical protein VGR69_10265 [Candidatus Rubrimentiphilum sp.]|nr:hypothetical protein [Candidatus Rubrimentiphilum sp.]
MNDEVFEKVKRRAHEALDETFEQTEEAADQVKDLLRKSAATIKKAADAAAQAIRDDINKRS